MSHPKVFISYSHDSPEHSQRVLSLAWALRDHGIDVELDQFHNEAIVDWPRWCGEQTSRECSDFVLCVCTAEYRRRIEGKVPPEKGMGVYWEGALLDDDLYDEKGNSRLIPVLFGDEPDTSIPRFLRGWTHCRLREFALDDPRYEHLLRILHRKAKVGKNPLGRIPELPTQSVATEQSVADATVVGGGFIAGLPRLHASPTSDRRRIDAAAPSQVALGETFDVLVQVKLPDSPPLSIEDWPRKTRPESVQTKSEPVNLEFPVDPVTRKAVPSRLLFKVVAPGCKVEGAQEKNLEVPVNGDSNKLTFLLRPTKKGISRIDVEVYSVAKDYLGTVPIETAVNAAPVEKMATVGSLVVVVVERKAANAGESADESPPPPPPTVAPDADSQHSPAVRLSGWQMLGLFVFVALLGAGSHFIHPTVSAVFLSLAMAIGTFGFLSAVAHVHNAYGKFGGSAGVAIACLLILLKVMPPTPAGDPIDIVGTVYVDGQPATAGVIRLLETSWADNTRSFSEGNPGTFEFKGLPDFGTSVTLQIDVNAPVDLPATNKSLPVSPGTRLRIDLTSPGSHINGRVKDSAGNAIAGARISAHGRVALTDGDGWFALTNLAVAVGREVSVDFRAERFEPASHLLVPGANEATIVLKPRP